MSTLPSQDTNPLLRRASAARLAVKRYDADPYLALYYAVWSSDDIEDAMTHEDEDA